MGKLLTIVVAFLSLLVAVYLTASYYISGTVGLPPLLRATLSNSGTLTKSAAASVWTRNNANDSFVAVDVDGNFTDRVELFNIELRNLRRQLLSLTTQGNDTNTTTCRSSGAVLQSIILIYISNQRNEYLVRSI